MLFVTLRANQGEQYILAGIIRLKFTAEMRLN